MTCSANDQWDDGQVWMTRFEESNLLIMDVLIQGDSPALFTKIK
jgi:hypothetical protein